MKTVVQRVARAGVLVDGKVVGAIGPGLLALVGVTHGDGPAEVDATVRQVAHLRILAGERSVIDAGAAVLVVSQFTLHADTRKGRRPSWGAAAPGDVAEPLVAGVASGLRDLGVEVATGSFGAHMEIDLLADGPVTLVLDHPPAVGAAARSASADAT